MLQCPLPVPERVPGLRDRGMAKRAFAVSPPRMWRKRSVRELLGALIVPFCRLVNGVGGAPHQAGQARADHDTSQHRFLSLGKACKRNDLKAGESGFRLWLNVESSPVEIGQICGVGGRG